jgi:hypothetical protein
MKCTHLETSRKRYFFNNKQFFRKIVEQKNEDFLINRVIEENIAALTQN